MLRSVRSLPTLRALKSAQPANASASSIISTRYHLVTPNIPDNEFHYTSRRYVHQTSKTNQTTLLNSKKSEFSLMSLNSLKQECRKRGLKISGRKAELVSRISSFESSFNSTPSHSHSMSTNIKKSKPLTNAQSSKLIKNFSSSIKQQAKGDDSHIDYIKPVDIEPPKLVEDDYIVQIPSISTKASQTPVTSLEKQLLADKKTAEEALNQTVVSKADGSDIKIFEQGSLEHIDEQNKAAEVVQFDDVIDDVLNAFKGETNTNGSSGVAGSAKEGVVEQPYEFDHSEIPQKDKTFWRSVALGVTGLFLLNKSLEKRNEK